MIRFWVGLGKPSGPLESWPTSNDVKNFFQVYGTVVGCQVKLHENGNLCAIVGISDCNIPTEEVVAQLRGLVLKGVPVLVHLFKVSEMCKNFANKGHCPADFACKFAHSPLEMKSKAKKAATGERQVLIQKPVTHDGALKQQILQWENDDLKEEIANLKLKVLKEKQRSNDLAVSNDNAWKLVGKMSLQIVQLTKENDLLKVKTAADDAKESIPGQSNSLEPKRSVPPSEFTQRV